MRRLKKQRKILSLVVEIFFFFFFPLSVGKEDSDCTIEINGKQMMFFIWNDGGTMFPALDFQQSG